MKLDTRIAPSPTGYFHLGTARTAYFNWLAARASGGKFILRIDDTDASRNDESTVQVIYDAMSYLGLDYDLSFKQSDTARRAKYAALAAWLEAKGKASKHDGAIWLRKPVIKSLAGIQDLTGITIPVEEPFSQVLIKADGSPTYHFASVVDDIDYGINLVIRGSDHVANTMRQIAIYEAFGATPPQYAHVGLLHDLSGPKLSKSRGAKSLLDFRDEGIHPEAMLSFLLRLGWGPKKDGKETAVLDRAQALALFLGGGNLRNQPSKVDFAKLASLNRRYR